MVIAGALVAGASTTFNGGFRSQAAACQASATSAYVFGGTSASTAFNDLNLYNFGTFSSLLPMLML
jgi:hypothetical protein